MLIRKLGGGRRRGAALVETGLIIILVTMFIFGVFEYGRLLMDWNMLNHTAREGSRYALVNNTASTITSDVQTLVINKMAGRNTSFTGFSVTVSGTHQGVATPVNNLVAGDLITVTVTGRYKFLNIIPLVNMPNSFSITSAVTMVCEGVT